VTARRPDRRVRRTREAIRQSLIDLMQEKGYDAVTVADIIERADIGRSTFYTHFTEKREVLYSSLEELATFLRREGQARGNVLGFSLPMFEHAHEQLPLVRGLLGRRGSSLVLRRVEEMLSDLVAEELRTAAARQRVDLSLNLVVPAVVGAYLALLAQWLEDPRYTPAEMDAAFRRLVIPGLIDLFGPDLGARPDA
jgi:AcrR family transcriptional regulator